MTSTLKMIKTGMMKKWCESWQDVCNIGKLCIPFIYKKPQRKLLTKILSLNFKLLLVLQNWHFDFEDYWNYTNHKKIAKIWPLCDMTDYSGRWLVNDIIVKSILLSFDNLIFGKAHNP